MSLRRIFVSLVLGGVPLVSASELPWEKLENCRLVESPSNDGDSVEIDSHGQRQVIRLFYVDCFEEGLPAEARRARQAKYFGILGENREKKALQIARAATRRAAAQLAKPFTVYTRGEKVDPAGKNSAVRAFVTTAQGRDLGELLVAEGLAVIREGKAASVHPDGRNVSVQISALRAMETRARLENAGAWGLARKTGAIPPPPQGKTDFDASARDELFSSAGRLVTVRGRVKQIAALPNGRMTFVDFEGNGEGGFVGIIRADFLPRFRKKFPEGLEAALVGKKIALKGVITLYRDIPQIELQRPDQISLK